jgi:glycosyltransferase involved in cell wall biosynthesis
MLVVAARERGRLSQLASIMLPVPPELSVVVASHERPLRLRWLLNALELQTLDRSRWEIVVCHDDTSSATRKLLGEHPLARAGVLRSSYDPRRSVGAKRNMAVELARGSTIVFTDDDCRPPPEWLARVWGAVQRDPDAIIQGPIEGDPDEWAMRRSPYPLTQSISYVPTPWAECCNIVYPRALVRRVGGFWERWGEDTDLNLRARATGAPYIGDDAMLTYHAIADASVLGWIRSSRRWGDLPGLFKRHPQLRSELFLGMFWKREHLLVLLALWGLLGARGNQLRPLAALPWAAGRGAHGENLRGRLRDVFELPGWAIIDLAELLILTRGSARHRTIVL